MEANQKHPVLCRVYLSHPPIVFNNPDSAIPPQYFPPLGTREFARGVIREINDNLSRVRGGHVARDEVVLVGNRVWTHDAWRYNGLSLLS